jgi:hypothetical protein
MIYGVYETEEEAESALEGIASPLQQNSPLRVVASHAGGAFLVPADKVHYVVCAEVERPTDQGWPTAGS